MSNLCLKLEMIDFSLSQVLPADKDSSKTVSDIPDPELKENNSLPRPSRKAGTSRPSSLLSEIKPLDPRVQNVPQSPENDDRTSEDYDPPWDLKGASNPLRLSGVNGSVSVPERLSGSGGRKHMPTSITHDKLDAQEIKDRPTASTKFKGF